jgi:hypothetical protein
MDAPLLFWFGVSGVHVLVLAIAVGASLIAGKNSNRQAPEVTLRSFFPRANTEQVSLLGPLMERRKKA